MVKMRLGWLNDWVTEWMTGLDWLTDWLTEWMEECMNEWTTNPFETILILNIVEDFNCFGFGFSWKIWQSRFKRIVDFTAETEKTNDAISRHS